MKQFRAIAFVMISTMTLTLNARTVPFPAPTIQGTSDLSERLAADKNFQFYAISTYDFILNVKEKKSGKLLLKYLEQSISSEEKDLLLSALSYESENTFRLFLINSYNLKIKLDEKFPELS